MPQVNDAVVEIRSVSKRYPGVQALEEVSLDIRPGEVHAVAGENGAGKSTLMKLLSQLERPSDGTIEIDGKPVRFRNPRHAQRLGIAMVHQEFALAPTSASPTTSRWGGSDPRRADRPWLREAACAGAAGTGRSSTSTRRGEWPALSVADQQRVEIAKALAVDAKVVIMDEPTATLTEPEIDDLFTLIEELKSDGIAIFYISHRLEEVVRIADRVTVMRDGQVVETLDKGDFDESRLVSLMVGREIDNLYPKEECEIGDVVLRVDGRSPGRAYSRTARSTCAPVRSWARGSDRGGTNGARPRRVRRRSDAARAGSSSTASELKLRSPSDAIAAGIGYLTEDRKGDGLAMQLSVEHNITLARIPGSGDLDRPRRRARGGGAPASTSSTSAPLAATPVEALSGGTQQKVVVARWLETEARVLFFDEPTVGSTSAPRQSCSS